MQITSLLNSDKISLSFEIFPPKQWSELDNAKTIVDNICKLSPSFVSVTYGAGGLYNDQTVEVTDRVQNINSTTALAHLTCVSATKEQIKNILSQLKSKNITNILALRGDMPQGLDSCNNYYQHASDLMKEIKDFGGFSIGGACYPEGHPESPNQHTDILNLKKKVESGCEFLTTQMFFDNNILYNYMYKLYKDGVNVPVVAGIMPVTNAKQIERICKLSGTVLPARFKAIVDKFSDNPDAMKQAGIAYATEQIIDLIANDVTNIHLYTMNKPDVAEKIKSNLSDIIK